jgi:uncharacterized membrane protein
MAINKNDEIRKSHTITDRLADTITKIAGSMTFLILNVLWFAFWLAINSGLLGENLIFDHFPFGFLTTAVSLEAIVLSTFVLISQKRQSMLSEQRAELDYRTDLESEVKIEAIVGMLRRIAKAQGVDVSDLLSDMRTEGREVLKEHPTVDESDG